MTKQKLWPPLPYTHPWRIEYPYPLEKRYVKSWADGRHCMRKDLEPLAVMFKSLNDQASLRRLEQVHMVIDRLPQAGGTINEVVDERTGVEYTATLVRRSE